MSKSGDDMSITRSRNHDCYEHYELKKYKKFFNCDGCKMKGFGERYTCNPCGRELHKECRHPQPEVSHENFAGSVFIFRNEPFTKPNKKNGKDFSKCCDACGKDICGFNYHCEADNKDLHPCCRKLEKKLVIDGTIFNLETKVSSKCGTKPNPWRRPEPERTLQSFDEGYSHLFGNDNLMVIKDGKSVHISLDERTCFEFVSQDLYLRGFFNASIKLPMDYTFALLVLSTCRCILYLFEFSVAENSKLLLKSGKNSLW
ncbi:unnamed protein product [Fraxinus pennsylvanica]|uniref:Phorbol-ester/DAG-type domain-containing protein n=1 Tax=Fraxinus pennsylvanica TaxID=56036 RepID=A0AAD2EDY9_9LAMI|nr:unnamed protein product [Fraxinus pennsylvanica]